MCRRDGLTNKQLVWWRLFLLCYTNYLHLPATYGGCSHCIVLLLLADGGDWQLAPATVLAKLGQSHPANLSFPAEFQTPKLQTAQTFTNDETSETKVGRYVEFNFLQPSYTC